MLIIVPTPIGNLKDITLRALETLEQSDGIICEDSRRTSLLLNHYQIKKPLLVLNDFNEVKQIDHLIQKLSECQNLALVSDAGTPLISDPGYKLVRECLAKNIPVDSIPGAASPIVALTLSGLPPDKFMFVGYLPEKEGQRTKLLQNLQAVFEITPTTFISFVAPFKLLRTLQDMQKTYGDIEITLLKELTKIHQHFASMPISSWIEQFKKANPKGEWIMIFRPLKGD